MRSWLKFTVRHCSLRSACPLIVAKFYSLAGLCLDFRARRHIHRDDEGNPFAHSSCPSRGSKTLTWQCRRFSFARASTRSKVPRSVANVQRYVLRVVDLHAKIYRINSLKISSVIVSSLWNVNVFHFRISQRIQMSLLIIFFLLLRKLTSQVRAYVQQNYTSIFWTHRTFTKHQGHRAVVTWKHEFQVFRRKTFTFA